MDKKIIILDNTINETISKCEWTKSQKCIDLISSIVEETSEVNEALKNNDTDNLEEEIGDLLFTVILFGKIAAKEFNISFENSIDRINKKIIRRSPHVFGNKVALNAEEAAKIWNSIKNKEYT